MDTVRSMQAGYIPVSYLLKNRIRRLLGAVTDATGNPIPIADRGAGVDISHWNPVYSYAKMRSVTHAVYFKCTEGTTYYDDTFADNRAGLAGHAWGPYHFLSTADGVVQANWFCDHLGSNRGPLPPCLDVELASVGSGLIKAFINRLYARLGIYPIIYTSAYFWSLVTGTEKQWIADRCALWVAHYYTDYPIIPTHWVNKSPQYIMHQWTPNGVGYDWGVSSASIDLDHVRKSWIESYIHIKTLEERVKRLEDEAIEHGWDLD